MVFESISKIEFIYTEIADVKEITVKETHRSSRQSILSTNYFFGKVKN